MYNYKFNCSKKIGLVANIHNNLCNKNYSIITCKIQICYNYIIINVFLLTNIYWTIYNEDIHNILCIKNVY